MLRHALMDAAERGLKEMHLAVDLANLPAMRLYRQEGFHEVQRRDVYIKPSAAPADAQKRVCNGRGAGPVDFL
jgi:ribosomal protein S18 acetylase RimI-like enzyme